MALSQENIKDYLVSLGFKKSVNVFYQRSPEQLQKEALDRNLAEEDENGVMCVRTGKFTGRAPEDRFIVKDDITSEKVDWGKINKPFEAADFDRLFDKVVHFLSGKEVFVRDVRACAMEKYAISIRTVCQYPWSSLFIRNMFIALAEGEDIGEKPDWLIVDAPAFLADPQVDKTLRRNFAIINFTKRIILVGGTGYTGEMKKGVFSVLNFTLPVFSSVLPMHCSANVGADGDTALFFGLSGTGKTTLSADPDRYLIGDDEHGWSEDGIVFNFEGGCYAKVIDLTEKTEPDIYRAIKPGAILENVCFEKGSKKVDFFNGSITQNTRVSYPINFIEKICTPSEGKDPKNIFFLTCDAFGVLPPVSKLDPYQAAFHFISGYTAKIAGTEEGIKEPVPFFSSSFGAPFMPLHPTVYANMLSDKIKKTGAKVWLINTGWVGGGYGVGDRIDLASTRAIIHAILSNDLDNVAYEQDHFFSLYYPKSCLGVDAKLLNPRKSWPSEAEYEEKAKSLAVKFHENFKQYSEKAGDGILKGAPEYGKS